MVEYLSFFFNVIQQRVKWNTTNLSIAGFADLFTDFQLVFSTIFFWGISNSWKTAGTGKMEKSYLKKIVVKITLQTREPLTDNYLHIVSLCLSICFNNPLFTHSISIDLCVCVCLHNNFLKISTTLNIKFWNVI